MAFKIPLMSDGSVRKFSDIGSYPLFYLDQHNQVICPDCVEKNLELWNDLESESWTLESVQANFENTELYCDDCSERVESAYCD